jgi:DNA-binding transcriptional regulator YbjK
MPPRRRHRPSAQARRDALLRATVEVAAERGTGGVTHRAVTEKAGLPLATVSYFFDSIVELAVEALRVFTAQDAARLSALADELARRGGSADEIARAFSAATAPTHPETLALFEAYLGAGRSPALRPAVTEALRASRRVAEEAARAAGAPDPAAPAQACVALLHGLALHQLAAPTEVAEDAAYRALRALFLGYLLDEGHTELALRLARR